MTMLRRMSAVLALVSTVAACGGDDGAASPAASVDTQPPTDALVSDDVPAAEVPPDDSTEEIVGGNASITLDDETFVFDSELCDLQAISGESVTGVITVDSTPTFVEIYAWGGDGSISLNVGLSSDTATDEPFEATLERGLVEVWNLFFETDDVTTFTDTEIRGSGTFLKVMSLDGSSGEERRGAFTADCS